MSPAASTTDPSITDASTTDANSDSPISGAAAVEATAAGSSAAALQVSTSPRPFSRLAVTVTVPAGRCKASYESALDRLSRTVKLPGFRKGKVPRPVLLQQIGPLRLRATALEALVDSVFREAARQEAIEALSNPELEGGFEAVLERFDPAQDLSFTLEFDVEPTPSLRRTRDLEAELEAVAFDPAQVEERLRDAQRSMATLVPVEGRAAASGDVAEVSFQGTFTDTGEAIEGGSATGMEVELEEGRMIPGFVEGVLGLSVGESRTITCRFPDTYGKQDAAGREASFEVTLIELKTRELPPLDDAFAQQAGDWQTMEELRTALEGRLREEAEERHRANRREALLDGLVEQLEVELPQSMVQEEIRLLLEQTASQLAQQGMDVRRLFTPDLVRSLRDTSRGEAERRLRRGLALRALAAAESIAVSDEELEAKLREVRRELSDSEARLDLQRLRALVAQDLLQDKLLEWLEANSIIRDKVAEPNAGESGREGAKPEGYEGDQAEAASPSGDTEAAAASDPID